MVHVGKVCNANANVIRMDGVCISKEKSDKDGMALRTMETISSTSDSIYFGNNTTSKLGGIRRGDKEKEFVWFVRQTMVHWWLM